MIRNIVKKDTIGNRRIQPGRLWDRTLGHTPKSLMQLFFHSFDESARSFSRLMDRDMVISSYKIEVVTGERFINDIESRLEESFFASIIKVEDIIQTNILFLLPECEGKRLYEAVSGVSAGGPGIVDDEMIAGIGELNNILGSTFINCLADTLEETIHGSIPYNTFDMLGAILQGVILQDEFINKEILCAETVIREKAENGFQTKLIILSDKTQLVRILERASIHP